MSIASFDKLQADIKTAMKAGEKEKVKTLRVILSEVKNISSNAGKELTEDMFLQVISRGIKQRKDSFSQFKDAGRDDLAVKEESEIALLLTYQPEQLSREELEAIVKECVAESGAESKKDMGKVMKLVMPRTKGKADGKEINQIVGSLLN